MSQIKEQIKAPEMEVNDEEIANLQDAQINGNQDAHRNGWVWLQNHAQEEKVDAMKSEVKENIQRTNTEGKETRTQIDDLEQKEDINIQQEQNEETRIPGQF